MNQIRVYLEVGQKKNFAGAVDWPGWCRSGKDEQSAIQSLFDYRQRYAQVLTGSGIDFEVPIDMTELVAIERRTGNATTDFGAPDAVLDFDQEPVNENDVDFFRNILQACWQTFDRTVALAQEKELRKGPRGGGRNLDKIIDHVIGGDHAYLRRLAWKYRRDQDAPLPAELARIRQAILDALDSAIQKALPEKGPRGGKVWPVRFFVRRIAWHVLDHTWEIEDRLM